MIAIRRKDEGGELRLLNLDVEFVDKHDTRLRTHGGRPTTQKYLEDEEDLDYAENMDLTTQYNVYEQVGRPVMSDLPTATQLCCLLTACPEVEKHTRYSVLMIQRQKILGTNINLYTSNGVCFQE